MKGLATGSEERLQDILTPKCIVDVCNKLWGEIALDPCWCVAAITNPVTVCIDGLKSTWLPKTYINPPYKDLKAWLAYGQTQPKEQIWLVPVRTNRGWFREWRDDLDVYCELNPLKFLGYDNYFPVPLLLGYVGARTIDFRTATFGLGDVYFKRSYD